MICENCRTKLQTKDTREKSNVRYRIYKCPNCGKETGTKEIMYDITEAKSEIEQMKEVYKKIHPEVVVRTRQNFYITHRAKMLKNAKKYYREHKEECKEAERERRQRKKLEALIG